jgi:S1-C subfamily serine protease
MRAFSFLILACAVMATGVWALTRDEENNVDIYRRFNAGVVNITSRAVSYDFFKNPVPTDSSGSGFILDQQGRLLTNNHVVKGAQRLEVSLADRTKWPAKVVGADPHTDLAVLEIKAPPQALTVMPLGDSSSLQVGQKVLAIGNPFGLEQSLSSGIVSMIRKVVKAGEIEIEDVIQTDAAINPGNSGGPLLNSEGQVVGINTAIFTPSGGNVGIGFAIPINTAKRVVSDILLHGFVAYPYFGAETQTLTPRIARLLQLPVDRGALVLRVWRNTPAASAGLLGGNQDVRIGNTIIPVGGDIIVGADGQPISSAEELRRIVRRHLAGDIIKLDILRRGRRGIVDVSLGERPRDGLSLKE